MRAVKILKHLLIAITDTVVRLVYNDHIKITRAELAEPLVAHQRLDGPNCDPVPAVQTCFSCAFNGASQTS